MSVAWGSDSACPSWYIKLEGVLGARAGVEIAEVLEEGVAVPKGLGKVLIRSKLTGVYENTTDHKLVMIPHNTKGMNSWISGVEPSNAMLSYYIHI